MPALDYETLKAFMHPALMDSFAEDEETGQNTTLTAAVKVAIMRYNALTGNLPEGAVIRFDSVTFQLKVAFCHIYEFILHDTGYLTSITLTGLGISENQVWEHFKALLDYETKEVEEMKEDLLDEIADKESLSRYAGVVLYHGGSSNGSTSSSSSKRRSRRR